MPSVSPLARGVCAAADDVTSSSRSLPAAFGHTGDFDIGGFLIRKPRLPLPKAIV
jgi:hypothetical protein